MALPDTYTNINETGCCAIPNVEGWDKKRIVFENKQFVRAYTKSFMHIPLNMAKVMTFLSEMVTGASAGMPANQAMILSRDISVWKSEQLYAVARPIEGADNVVLNGIYLTRVFEGSYRDAESWYSDMLIYAEQQGYKAKNVYFFYTTCPKCSKYYGKNYTIALAEI
jgi:hypothetical protein